MQLDGIPSDQDLSRLVCCKHSLCICPYSHSPVVLDKSRSDNDMHIISSDCTLFLNSVNLVTRTVISEIVFHELTKKMSMFKQEWISPVLEVYKKRKIEETYTVILGLNPLGQALCRHLYERNNFESVLIFNSPAFSSWNKYPVDAKAPVVPIHGMVNDEIMLIFGDVMIKEFDWMTDLLFYLRGNVPTKFVISMVSHDGQTCGQVFSKKGDRLLKKMDIPIGRADYYDGVTAPLISAGNVAGFDPVVLFIEENQNEDLVLQIDYVSVFQSEINQAIELLEKGLTLNLIF